MYETNRGDLTVKRRCGGCGLRIKVFHFSPPFLRDYQRIHTNGVNKISNVFMTKRFRQANLFSRIPRPCFVILKFRWVKTGPILMRCCID